MVENIAFHSRICMTMKGGFYFVFDYYKILEIMSFIEN